MKYRRGIVGQYDRSLATKRKEMIDGPVHTKRVLSRKYEDMKLADLRALAREKQANLRGATKKEDVIEKIVDHVCSTTDYIEEVQSFLRSDDVRLEADKIRQIHELLQHYECDTHDDLLAVQGKIGFRHSVEQAVFSHISNIRHRLWEEEKVEEATVIFVCRLSFPQQL